jgi:hypothetical protein
MRMSFCYTKLFMGAWMNSIAVRSWGVFGFGLLVLLGLSAQAADYPIQMPKTSSSYLFSESINQQIGFSIYQADTALADLFNKNVTPAQSELCGPTTVANQMALYKLSAPEKYKNLALKYSPEEKTYVNQVREYFSACKTDPVHGTKIVDLSRCIDQTFTASGFASSEVKVIGPEILQNLDPRFATSPHVIGIQDIRDAFKNGYGVIMHIKWFHPVESGESVTWETDSGHYILVVGYDYDDSFGDQKIILKVVNPDVIYASRGPYQRFDNIEMMKIPKKPGMKYPSGADYILDGFSFKGYPNRAFVRYLILDKPSSTP